MSIAIGGNSASKVYLGSTEVSKMYLGSDLVYGGSVLPYDSEVEYLQSNGSQYIELPIVPNEATDCIEIEFRRTSNTNQQRFFFACPVGKNTSQIFQSYINGNGRIAVNIDGSWSALSSTDDSSVGLVHHRLKFDYANSKVTYDGQTYTIGSTSRQGLYNLILFGKYGSNAVFQGLVYAVRYWRNGVMTYNLQPVRKSGTGYLYDKIGGGMYGNSGTGNFTIGYDKLTSLSDYTQLDYIQNTSTGATAPYIDTGVCSTLGVIDMSMVVKWDSVDSSKRQLFGSSYTPFWGCDGGIYKSSGQDMGLPSPSTSSYDNIDMTQYSETPSYPQNMSLFRAVNPTNRVQTATTYICLCKLNAYQIKVDSVLVRDYVSVLHPSGVYGMFDKVENKFYASANSGTFTGGYDE